MIPFPGKAGLALIFRAALFDELFIHDALVSIWGIFEPLDVHATELFITVWLHKGPPKEGELDNRLKWLR